VLIAFRRHEGKCWLEVWDTGIGISNDKLDFVFDEFTQIGSIGAAKGSGLGLAIVAKTAGVLDLRVRVRSRPGRGSMFSIEVREGRKTEPKVEIVREVKYRRLRIGLVEDDSSVLEAIVMALETAGHQVVSATTGDGLMKLLGAQAPDIVISDYRLGTRKTGFDVIKEARAAFGANLPAHIITGDTDPALIRSMTKHGIGIQYKPIKFDTLMTMVGRAAERRAP
jgi:CheY-like chemotaxis protein